MYAHHGSKAALNMVGKLLSMNLKGEGVAVGMVHPGFMRTEMTAGVGFDKVCLSPSLPFLFAVGLLLVFRLTDCIVLG